MLSAMIYRHMSNVFNLMELVMLCCKVGIQFLVIGVLITDVLYNSI